MSADIDVRPGQRIKVIDVDGTEYEDTVHSVYYHSAEPEILQYPTGWRRLVRRLTPAHWRKPLPVVRPYRPSTFEITCASDEACTARATGYFPGRNPQEVATITTVGGPNGLT